MNCKPGDMAIIIKPPFAGRLVEILYLAPGHDHVLPDGHMNAASGPDNWVIKSLGSPFPLRTITGGFDGVRKGMYAACLDKYLRPLPGKREAGQRLRETIA